MTELTWMQSAHGDEAKAHRYWIRKREVPQWLFFLAVALWPSLRRSFIEVEKLTMRHNERLIAGARGQ